LEKGGGPEINIVGGKEFRGTSHFHNQKRALGIFLGEIETLCPGKLKTHQTRGEVQKTGNKRLQKKGKTKELDMAFGGGKGKKNQSKRNLSGHVKSTKGGWLPIERGKKRLVRQWQEGERYATAIGKKKFELSPQCRGRDSRELRVWLA